MCKAKEAEIKVLKISIMNEWLFRSGKMLTKPSC